MPRAKKQQESVRFPRICSEAQQQNGHHDVRQPTFAFSVRKCKPVLPSSLHLRNRRTCCDQCDQNRIQYKNWDQFTPGLFLSILLDHSKVFNQSKNLPTVENNFCQILNKHSINWQGLLIFCQSGEISPNLVTLPGSQSDLKGQKPSILSRICHSRLDSSRQC